MFADMLFNIQQDIHRDHFNNNQMIDMYERDVWTWDTYVNSRSDGGNGFKYDFTSGGTSGGW